MPNRILREGINDSRAVNFLSDQAEIFYRRLMSVVDDFGRYENSLPLLRARLFPLKLDEWPEERVQSALQECSETFLADDEPLVEVYSVGNKQFLQINRFGQRTRTESKFPAPGSEPIQQRVGSVYFIQAEISKKIKIGYTEVDPLSRLSALQIGSSEKLSLLWAIPGSPSEERELHKRFTQDRVSGEWFTPSKAIMEFISSSPQLRASAGNCAQARGIAARATRARSESEAESYAESYAEAVRVVSERMYALHPKKKDKPLFEVALLKAVEKTKPEGREQFLADVESVHAAWCDTDEWQKDDSKYVPRLALWISDQGYTKRPKPKPQPPPPIDPSKIKPWDPLWFQKEGADEY